MAFPTTALLDSFTRADEDPVASGWLGPIYPAETQLKIVSNRLSGAVGDSYYNTTYGPDCEAYVTMPTVPGNGNHVNIFARIQAVGTAGMDAYRVHLTKAAGTDTVDVQKVVNTTSSTLASGTFNQEVSAGDSLGIECVGTAISAYYKSGAGAWTLLGTCTDATITASGFIGLEIDDAANGSLDDFGGGTVVSGAEKQSFYVTRRRTVSR